MKKLLLIPILTSAIYADKLQEKSEIKASYENKKTTTIDRDILAIEANLLSTMEIGKLTSSIEYKEEKNQGIKTDDKKSLSLLLEQDRTDFYGNYYKVKYNEDSFNKIDNEKEAGLGLYQYIVNRDNVLFKTREGLKRIDTLYVTGKSEVTNYLKLGFIIKGVNTLGVTASSQLDYDKDLKSSNYTLDSKTTLSTKITEDFGLELSYKYKYMYAPSIGPASYEKTLLTSLTYKF